MRHGIFVLLLILGCFSPSARLSAATLAERLGYTAQDRLLIVNADDAGMCQAANEATFEGMERGHITSATVMVPCPWFAHLADYARQHPARAFGVHLVHTAEWRHYRWPPLLPKAQVPGLVDAEGYLWRSIEQVYAHATPTEALAEGRAQIQRALTHGMDVTHLDSHMGTLQLKAEYLPVYLQLAVEFDLPVRMASQATLERFGQPQLRGQFTAKGILFPDDFIYEELKEESKDVPAFWKRIVRGLKPGVTELYIHPAKPTPELKAITGSWATRAAEFETFTHDREMKALLESERIMLISFRPLRELQRQDRRTAR
jgi:hypothetical protein